MPDGAVNWLVTSIPSKDTSSGNEDHFRAANSEVSGFHLAPSWEGWWCPCSQEDF